MGNIVLLDELTINKIAAGEVIERPASVIKEMVENSIDAGADNICVEIRNGGITYIRITDNGKGISKDDLELAFERHATSKIRVAEDLNTVTTMGFRGEALASIAAISKVEMVSKREEDEIGNRIIVEGGNIQTIEETGCSKGTTITVQNLFYNTPVRYKFLKKDYTESGYIEDVITRIALVNPNIAIKLINTGKTIIQTTGNGDIKSVIYSIYGKDIANAILEAKYNYEDIEVSGVIGKPEIARSNRTNQMFFVNGRFIKDKVLSSAVEQAFKGLLPIGRYGFLILNIKMDPSKVDVNVHPAKLEVRFQEENKIFKAIYHTIKETLLKAELVEDTTKEKHENVIPNQNEFSNMFRKISETESKNNNDETIADLYSHKIEDKIEEVKKEMPNEETVKILEQLAKMQSDLKKEVENNPNLKLNISQISKDQEELQKILHPESFMRQTKVQETETEYTYISSQDEEENKKIDDMPEPISSEYTEKNDIPESIQIENESLEGQNQTLELLHSEELREDVNESISNSQEQSEEFGEINVGDNQNDIGTEESEHTEDDENSNQTFSQMYEAIFGKKLEEEIQEKKRQEEQKPFSAFEPIKENQSLFEKDEQFAKPYKFIGIVFLTYIILEIDDEMYMIDQHAAHERILYEKVKKNFYSDTEKNCQMLLLPDIITLTHKEMDIAKDNLEIFRKAGFDVEEFGENTLKVNGVPDICVNLNTKELFLETLDEINTIARTAKQEIEDRFIATVACKAAVKAHMKLSKEEVDSIITELLKLPNPFTCPHGRPTTIKMKKAELEKKFARRM